ncbi:MAG: molybdopterin molybdenumtransferase MoeA [Candidatus Aenigmatarchaeota archaeon]|nr:MAG: molybdopterin molybdenumtransferase MoeA [Candidatus Aenigmarchaeota archaeon]
MAGARLKGFKELTPIEKALQLLFDTVKPQKLESELVPTQEAYGRVTANDIIAGIDLPPFNRSAVDGYAVRAEDTFEASPFHPKTLKITEKDEVEQGEAKLIWTGNPLPKGSDAVVMIEHTKKLSGNEIAVLRPVARWQNVSMKGEDVKAGEVAVKAGTRLKPWHLGLLAALRMEQVEVTRKPRVAILATGEELVELGHEPPENKIIETNRLVISWLCRELGAKPVDLGIVGDNEPAIREKILEGTRKADIVITTGGTSVGKADLVPLALQNIDNSAIVAHGMAMRPAMPTALAVIDKKPVILLSGNPVAAMIGFEVFARPLILRMLGLEEERPRLRAKITRRVAGVLGRKVFLRVKVYEKSGEFYAEPIRTTGSGVFTTMTEANGYVIIPENREGLEENETVTVYLFDNVPIKRKQKCLDN